MKRFYVFLLVAMLIIPVAGLSAQDTPDHRATDPFWNATDEQLAEWRVIDGVEEGAEITFWTMSLSPTFDEYIQKIVENFEATYPEVDVTWQDQPWDSLQDQVRSGFSAGEIPDVININPAWVAEFAEAGLLMNMDEALADYPEIRDQYSDGAFNTYAYDGASYQIPWYLGLTDFLAYNQTVLDDLGLTVEDLPTTWPELRDFAQSVHDETGSYALSLNFGTAIERNVLNYLIYNDIPVFNEDGTEVIFNTPEAAESLQLWVDLIQNDLVPMESLTDDHRAMIDRFSEGETAIVMVAPHMLRLVEENNADVFANMGVAPGVGGSSGAHPVDVQSLVVPAGTAYPNAALALAVFVTNPETQAAFAKEVGIYPSNLLSYEDPFFDSAEEGNPISAIRPIAEEYVMNADNRPVTFPNAPEIEQIILEEQEAALLGTKTAQEALDAMVTRINEVLAAA